MRIICVGGNDFCDMFAIAGTGSFICAGPAEAARFIAERNDSDEIVFIPETFAFGHDRDLESVMNDPRRIIIPLPSISSDTGAEQTRVILRNLLGAVWD